MTPLEVAVYVGCWICLTTQGVSGVLGLVWCVLTKSRRHSRDSWIAIFLGILAAAVLMLWGRG